MAGHYQNTIENEVTGKPVKGATVKVYVDGATIAADGKSVTTGTLATIFSDDGTTQINQTSAPLTTASNGEFDFYTDETRVVIEVLFNGTGLAVWNDTDIVGGSVSSDVTALAVRVSATENVTQDTMVVSLAALDDPDADRIAFWDDSAGGLAWLTAGSGLTIAGTTISASGASGDLLAANNLSDVASAATSRSNLGLAIGSDVQAYDAKLNTLVPVFNFSADGEVRLYADVAMTLTQQATSGTGTVAYEKSTNAAPGTFASTTSPVALEAGAWLKVAATSVSSIFAVALKRTA